MKYKLPKEIKAQSDNVIPIPGTKQRKYLAENADAMDIELTANDLEVIEAIARKYPDIGPRYSGRENKFKKIKQGI